MIQLINANSLHIPLADKSVQCVVTSPPYWGLRSYDTGDQKHNELGSEATPEEYVAHMVDVFREVRRVLRDDGVIWVNLGDTYASAWVTSRRSSIGAGSPTKEQRTKRIPRGSGRYGGGNVSAPSLKEKDLVGIPWMVAFALRNDGWYLRSDVIWNKPNFMPESVTDRPTKAHEYIFLLAKKRRYFYDADAILEPASKNTHARVSQDVQNQIGSFRAYGGEKKNGPMKAFIRTPKAQPAGSGIKNNESMNNALALPVYQRNKRTVWDVPTAGYSGAHFATFPPALIIPMIKAGTSPQACEHCGAPWERIIEKGYRAPNDEERIAEMKEKGIPRQKANLYGGAKRDPKLYLQDPDRTIGWQQTCACPNSGGTGRCIVLDPFVGSGTTLLVVRQLGRSGIGLDLSFNYLYKESRERLSLTALEEFENGVQAEAQYDDLPLFKGIE